MAASADPVITARFLAGGVLGVISAWLAARPHRRRPGDRITSTIGHIDHGQRRHITSLVHFPGVW